MTLSHFELLVIFSGLSIIDSIQLLPAVPGLFQAAFKMISFNFGFRSRGYEVHVVFTYSGVG